MTDDELRRKMFERGTMTATRFLAFRPREYADIDGPGCYAIVSDPVVDDNGEVSFSDIYVGQSVHVCARLREHLLGHGNAHVAEDLGEGRDVHVCVMRCDEPGLDDLEVALIRAFDATSYANELPGGNGAYGRRTCQKHDATGIKRVTWQASIRIEDKEKLRRWAREDNVRMAELLRKMIEREERRRRRKR